MSNTVATVIGYVLFAVSEILPLVHIPANGILHTFILGFKNAFSSPSKDIELAESLIITNTSFANIVNTLSTNHQMKTLVESVIQDPELCNHLSLLIKNPNLLNSVMNSIQSKQIT